MAKSKVMLIALVVVGVFVFSEAQEDLKSLFAPRVCVPTCQNTIAIKETMEMAEASLKKYPDIAKEIERLEAEEAPAEKSIQITPKCPCESKCERKYERIYYCNNCRIIWPRWGISNVACQKPNSYCPLGCGCPGRCNAYGPRYTTVVLYCPRQSPPFVIKRVRTCSNCCCQANYYWPVKEAIDEPVA